MIALALKRVWDDGTAAGSKVDRCDPAASALGNVEGCRPFERLGGVDCGRGLGWVSLPKHAEIRNAVRPGFSINAIAYGFLGLLGKSWWFV